jgi:DNA polymerase/3'-5' exonuclease PolX
MELLDTPVKENVVLDLTGDEKEKQTVRRPSSTTTSHSKKKKAKKCLKRQKSFTSDADRKRQNKWAPPLNVDLPSKERGIDLPSNERAADVDLPTNEGAASKHTVECGKENNQAVSYKRILRAVPNKKSKRDYINERVRLVNGKLVSEAIGTIVPKFKQGTIQQVRYTRGDLNYDLGQGVLVEEGGCSWKNVKQEVEVETGTNEVRRKQQKKRTLKDGHMKTIVNEPQKVASQKFAGLLTGVEMLIVPKNMSCKQISILQERAQKQGAIVHTTFDSALTHLVISGGVSLEKVLSHCAVSSLPSSLKLHTPAWLSGLLGKQTGMSAHVWPPRAESVSCASSSVGTDDGSTSSNTTDSREGGSRNGKRGSLGERGAGAGLSPADGTGADGAEAVGAEADGSLFEREQSGERVLEQERWRQEQEQRRLREERQYPHREPKCEHSISNQQNSRWNSRCSPMYEHLRPVRELHQILGEYNPSRTAGTVRERKMAFLQRNEVLLYSAELQGGWKVFDVGVGSTAEWLLRGKSKWAFATTGGATATHNYNAHLTAKLQERMDQLDTVKKGSEEGKAAPHRKQQYRKIITKLKSCDFELATFGQAKEFLRSSFSDVKKSSIVEKIGEIFDTGTISIVDNVAAMEATQSHLALVGIWGVGAATAHKLYEKGYRSVEQLREAVRAHEEQARYHAAGGGGVAPKPILTAQQLVGLKHYEDFQRKIPREEVGETEAEVRRVAEELMPGCIAMCCGSYRRGKSESGDCDVLITHPLAEFSQLHALLKRLEASGFLTEHLSYSSSKDTDSDWDTTNSSGSGYLHQGHRWSQGGSKTSAAGNGWQGGHLSQWQSKVSLDRDNHVSGFCDTYMGVCKARSCHRRLDIKVYPFEQFAFAVLYFTGSSHLNRSMRLYAKKKGWSLSDHGLCEVLRVDEKGSKTQVGPSLRCISEEEVFWALGLEYIEATDRNCFDGKKKC